MVSCGENRSAGSRKIGWVEQKGRGTNKIVRFRDGCSDERRCIMFSGTHLLAVQVAVNFWWNRLDLSAWKREFKKKRKETTILKII